MAHLVDTNILIDAAKGKEAAITHLDLLSESWSISVITAMEVIVGARDKSELKSTEDFLKDIPIVPLSPSVGMRAYDLLKTFSHSHGLRILDAMIAATAIEETKTLVTRNQKHFRMIPNLLLDVPNY
jgi:predicted nucleic acid-binding protein